MKYQNHISTEELEKIERFLTHDMTEDEANAFEKQLTENSELQEKTEEIRLLLLGIKESSLQQRLQSFHKDIRPALTVAKKNSGVISLGRKLLVAASILAITTITLWWFLQNNNSNNKLYSRYYSPDPGLPTVMSSSADYNFEKAMVEYKNGEYDKALKAWTIQLKETPGNDTLIYFVGVAYQAKKQDTEAIKYLGQTAADTSSVFYKEACWYLGLSYLRQGENQLAIRYIEQSEHPQRTTILKDIKKE